MYTAKIKTSLKKSILDPQGQTTLHALEKMGYEEAKGLRIGKYFELQIDAKTTEEAEKKVSEICDKLLCNPVIEDFSFKLEESAAN